jgi:hypothetical protein
MVHQEGARLNKFVATGVRGPIGLRSKGRVAAYAITAGVWTSGVAWLLFHYFLRRQTEFGLEPHPLEHWWLRLHGAFAFATLWLIGFLSAGHILNGWAAGRRRWSGAFLLAAACLLTITGYLLYYAGGDVFRKSTSLIHWELGIFSALLLLSHRSRGLRYVRFLTFYFTRGDRRTCGRS